MIDHILIGHGDLREGTGIGRWGDALWPLTDLHKPPPKGVTEGAGAVSEENILRITVKSPLFGKPLLPPPFRSLQFIGVYDEKELEGECRILSIAYSSDPVFLIPLSHTRLNHQLHF